MKQEIKLICFDLNGTLIRNNSWYDLNLAMGVSKHEDELLYNKYHRGKISYQDWLKILLDIYKTRGEPTRANIEKVVFRYSYLKDAGSIVKYLKNKGYKVVLVSAAMDILVKKVASELIMDGWASNNILLFGKDERLRSIKIIDDEAEAKVVMLRKICRSYGISIKECVCVGDGMNDRLIFDNSGRGITFRGTEIVKYAWHVINDLGDIKNVI